MKKSRGFTLIELLVVIAIIGILASIVLVALTGTRKKAKDAAIQTDIYQAKTLAEELYIENNNYSGLCDDDHTLKDDNTRLKQLEDDIKKNQGGTLTLTCYTSTSNDAYCIEAKLNNGKYYCVDSTGVTKTNDSAQCTGAGADCTP